MSQSSERKRTDEEKNANVFLFSPFPEDPSMLGGLGKSPQSRRGPWPVEDGPLQGTGKLPALNVSFFPWAKSAVPVEMQVPGEERKPDLVSPGATV